jgi:hypothetical protein
MDAEQSREPWYYLYLTAFAYLAVAAGVAAFATALWYGARAGFATGPVPLALLAWGGIMLASIAVGALTLLALDVARALRRR